MQKKHYCYMDYLRVIAAYCVVLIHTIAPYDPAAPLIRNIMFDNIHCILNFAVPVFLMISGALFLGGDREYTFREMTFKYARKPAICVLVFCTFFSMLELVFSSRTINLEIIGTSLLNMLNGKSFDHMWYLYMIIGLYLITPLIKPFLKKADKKEVLWLLAILFFFESFIPLLNAIFKTEIAFGIPITKMNIFYYILGYWAVTFGNDKTTAAKRLLILFSAVLGVFIINSLNLKFELKLPQLCNYVSIFLIIITYNIFMLAKNSEINPNSRITRANTAIAPLCLGIYIIHPLFLHFMEKIFHVSSAAYPYFIFVFVYGALIFAASGISVWIYKKIFKCIKH